MGTASTWTEADAIYAARKGLTLADLILARHPEAAREVLGQEVPAEIADVEAVEEAPADTCASGSCRHARPGTSCACECQGAQHGAASTLAPADCQGTRLLVEVDPRGGYRYPRCPGCPACRRPVLVAVPGGRRRASVLV